MFTRLPATKICAMATVWILEIILYMLHVYVSLLPWLHRSLCCDWNNKTVHGPFLPSICDFDWENTHEDIAMYSERDFYQSIKATDLEISPFLAIESYSQRTVHHIGCLSFCTPQITLSFQLQVTTCSESKAGSQIT